MIIISNGVQSRRLKGTFRLYGSKKDLLSIVQQIKKQTEMATGFDVGWVDIADE